MRRSILMLEYDEDDRYITQAVFDEHHYDVKIYFVNNLQELLSHLHRCQQSGEALPSLILLNFHTGPSNAIAIIEELKQDKSYSHIPIVVLSGTVNKEIIRACYSAGASSFIQKPVKSADTDAKISNFFHYWFKTVEMA
jgi:CheY-like chemotaxis protein